MRNTKMCVLKVLKYLRQGNKEREGMRSISPNWISMGGAVYDKRDVQTHILTVPSTYREMQIGVVEPPVNEEMDFPPPFFFFKRC